MKLLYAVAYVLGSFRDSPAPRWAAGGCGALRITRPTKRSRGSASLPVRSQQVATLPCGLTEVVASAVGGRAAARPSHDFGPVVGLCCTHRCQGSVALPFWGKTETIIPHPPAQNKPGFCEFEVLRTRGSASLPALLATRKMRVVPVVCQRTRCPLAQVSRLEGGFPYTVTTRGDGSFQGSTSAR